MSYEFYKLLHILGAFTVLMALGGMTLHLANGGTRDFTNRKWLAMIHGVGLALSLVAGFGLLARIAHEPGLPSWVIGKLVIWLILGGAPALFYRKRQFAKLYFFGVLLLAICAVGLAIYKP